MSFRNRSAQTHQFAMIPRADVPRSSFRMQKTLKTTFDASYLVPVMVEEILPGDTFNVKMTAFCRLATPLFPVMDNLHLESFFFFVPMRLVWTNWVRFMGERDQPDASIDFTIPVMTTPTNGYAIGSLYDYMGLPTVGQVAVGNNVYHSCLPVRAYTRIWNEWFRDQNTQEAIVSHVHDGPDVWSNNVLMKRGKRHDYFTSALPWPQKGEEVSLPLGVSAPVIPTGDGIPQWRRAGGPDTPEWGLGFANASNATSWFPLSDTPTIDDAEWADPKLAADLTGATAATINQLRQAFQVQKLLERDARGGTRYTEIVRAHFGVISPDARLQRPEYLGGGHSMVVINPVAQTSATAASGTDTPQGNLAAIGTALAQGHGFTQSFTEHGYVIGMVNVRADLTYQQGLRRMWSRSTRYDFYFPVFATLGEQAVLSKEIYCDGTIDDELVFGYQERWAEYRYNPSQVTGLMRSTAPGTIDAWHYAQRFATRPLLNESFITDNASDAVVERTTAVGSAANGQQFIMDAFFDIQAARPMPMYSVPGLIDHF